MALTILKEQHKPNTVDENDNDPQTPYHNPAILVMGIGGAGGNSVSSMAQKGLKGVYFAVADTDSQALNALQGVAKIQLGLEKTQGLGAGSDPDVGTAAAEESLGHIQEMLQGIRLLFLVAGMGGGTGTGATPVIARIAQDMGILSVAFTINPFQYEGKRRETAARIGTSVIMPYVDAMIALSNQNIFKMLDDDDPTIEEAFAKMDMVLCKGVQAITDLMVSHGRINLDFNDIHSVLANAGRALIGMGEAKGQTRVKDVMTQILNNPLFDNQSIKGAKRLLVNITAKDPRLKEIDSILNHIREYVDNPEVMINHGIVIDASLDDTLRIALIIAGLTSDGLSGEVQVNGKDITMNIPQAAEKTLNVETQQVKQTTKNEVAVMDIESISSGSAIYDDEVDDADEENYENEGNDDEEADDDDDIIEKSEEKSLFAMVTQKANTQQAIKPKKKSIDKEQKETTEKKNKQTSLMDIFKEDGSH